MDMELWALEVKPRTTITCHPGNRYVLRLTLVSIGESNNASENAWLHVKVQGQKYAFGKVSALKNPQVVLDLAFDKEFELSHTSKDTSVFFWGYKVRKPADSNKMDLHSKEDKDSNEVEKDESHEAEDETTKKLKTGRKRAAVDAETLPFLNKKAKVSGGVEKQMKQNNRPTTMYQFNNVWASESEVVNIRASKGNVYGPTRP